MTAAPFLHAHATHPDWRMALSLALAQIDAQRKRRAAPPTLGWVYISDHYAAAAQPLYDSLRRQWPEVAWVGCVGVGVAASGVEYIDEPALVLMLAALPRQQFRVYSGAQPLGSFAAHTALVHADGATHDLGELLAEFAERTTSGYLFGGLASSRGDVVQFADGVLRGGLSGVSVPNWPGRAIGAAAAPASAAGASASPTSVARSRASAPRGRRGSAPRSRSRQSSAGSPSSVCTTWRSAAVTRRCGPTGWQPCVRRDSRPTSRVNATPERPPRSTPSANCTTSPRDEASPPNR